MRFIIAAILGLCITQASAQSATEQDRTLGKCTCSHSRST